MSQELSCPIRGLSMVSRVQGLGEYLVSSLSPKVRPDLTRLASETFLSPCTTSLAGLFRMWKSSVEQRTLLLRSSQISMDSGSLRLAALQSIGWHHPIWQTAILLQGHSICQLAFSQTLVLCCPKMSGCTIQRLNSVFEQQMRMSKSLQEPHFWGSSLRASVHLVPEQISELKGGSLAAICDLSLLGAPNWSQGQEIWCVVCGIIWRFCASAMPVHASSSIVQLQHMDLSCWPCFQPAVCRSSDVKLLI